MTGTDRVLRALRSRREHGVSAVDFQAPDTIDGGAPILRVPARIGELEQRGFQITHGPDRRNKCVVYRLRTEPVPVNGFACGRCGRNDYTSFTCHGRPATPAVIRDYTLPVATEQVAA